MALRLGDQAPDFTAETTEGTVNLYDYLGDGWGVLFSHPKDFTPVCTTELGMVSKLKPEFDKRNVKVIGLSVDPLDSHKGWAGDIEETQGTALNFPLIADSDRKVSDLYDMIHPNANDTLTVRSVFIIGPDKKVKLIITYPASTGRNFDEILRVIDSLQLTAKLQRRHAGELEGRRGRHHRPRGLRRRRQDQVPQGLEGNQALPQGHPPAQQVAPPAGVRQGFGGIAPKPSNSRGSDVEEAVEADHRAHQAHQGAADEDDQAEPSGVARQELKAVQHEERRAARRLAVHAVEHAAGHKGEAEGDAAADDALHDAFGEERHPHEEVRRADELHHLDLSSTGVGGEPHGHHHQEHRRDDRARSLRGSGSPRIRFTSRKNGSMKRAGVVTSLTPGRPLNCRATFST